MKLLIQLFIAFVFCIFNVIEVQAQDLVVKESPDKKKVDRSVSNGISEIIFESKVKDLKIQTNDFEGPDEFMKIFDDLYVYRIKPYKDSVDQMLNMPVYPRRSYILKSPETNEYLLEIPEILPNRVYYYTVILPNQYPLNITAEYIFAKSSKNGIRVSFGKRIGGYFSYRWGEFRPTGNNIDVITTDCDITSSSFLGYCRTVIVGGVRLGVFHSKPNHKPIGLYLLVGGGYGEYARQWQNITQVHNNIYYYSDYVKGFNVELATQCTFKWFVFSVGVDMLAKKERISIDYQVGVGINLNINNRIKKQKK